MSNARAMIAGPPLRARLMIMRQTFDDAADPSFGPEHLPLIREQMAAQGLDGFLIPA